MMGLHASAVSTDKALWRLMAQVWLALVLAAWTMGCLTAAYLYGASPWDERMIQTWTVLVHQELHQVEQIAQSISKPDYVKNPPLASEGSASGIFSAWTFERLDMERRISFNVRGSTGFNTRERYTRLSDPYTQRYQVGYEDGEIAILMVILPAPDGLVVASIPAHALVTRLGPQLADRTGGEVLLGPLAPPSAADEEGLVLTLPGWGKRAGVIPVGYGRTLPKNSLLVFSWGLGAMLGGLGLLMVINHLWDQLRALQKEQATLTRQVNVDGLTEVFNRRYLMAHGEELFTTALNGQRPFSLIVIDLDHFKAINDRFGHAAGDLALRHAASRFRDVIDGSPMYKAVLGRAGGEEFLVLLPGVERDDAMILAERMRRSLVGSDCITPTGQLIRVRASLGVSARGPLCPGFEHLVREADEALYEAKATGRDRVVCYGRAAATSTQVPLTLLG